MACVEHRRKQGDVFGSSRSVAQGSKRLEIGRCCGKQGGRRADQQNRTMRNPVLMMAGMPQDWDDEQERVFGLAG